MNIVSKMASLGQKKVNSKRRMTGIFNINEKWRGKEKSKKPIYKVLTQ
jgi:hypothetical protein